MSDVTDTSLGIEAHKRRGLLGDFFIRLVREKPLGTAGGLVVLVLLCAGIFADVLAPYPYAEIHLESILEGPSGQYLLGTDQLGRDVLSRIIYGARVSVIVGLAATTISVLGATALGGLCGFLGGKIDLIVQRLVDAWMAFPGLLLLLTIMSVVVAGYATADSGPGDNRLVRWFKGIQKRRYWYQGEHVYDGGEVNWRPSLENPYTACPAQYVGSRNHHVYHRDRWCNPG